MSKRSPATVGATLRVLHVIGLIAGGIFALCTAILFIKSGSTSKGRYQNQLLLAAIMLAATAYLQASVLPSMEQDRIAAGGNIDAAPPNSVPRTHFERLHKLSERIEGGILLCGLGIIFLMARESQPALSPSPKTVDL